jgi:putative ubiquitin-RnfH superfamily antitoxin RatB of RatAB toxin-antitoxin module
MCTALGAYIKDQAMHMDPEVPNNRVRLNLVITKQLDATLGQLATENGTNKSEILRKALALYEVASEAKEQGNRLGIFGKDRQLLTEIVGL